MFSLWVFKNLCNANSFLSVEDKDAKTAARKESVKHSDEKEEPIGAVTDGSLKKVPSPLEGSVPTKAEKELELLAAENLKHDEDFSGTLPESSSESEASRPRPDSLSVSGKDEDKANDETSTVTELTHAPKLPKLEDSDIPVQNGMVDEMAFADQVVQNGFYNSSSDENGEQIDQVRNKLPVLHDESSELELERIKENTLGRTNQSHFPVSMDQKPKEVITFERQQKKFKAELFDKGSEQEDSQDIIEEDFNLDSPISDATNGYESLTMTKSSDLDSFIEHEKHTDLPEETKYYHSNSTKKHSSSGSESDERKIKPELEIPLQRNTNATQAEKPEKEEVPSPPPVVEVTKERRESESSSSSSQSEAEKPEKE